jgi:hypothetical protein
MHFSTAGETSWQDKEIRKELIRVARKRLLYMLINSTAVYILTYLLSYLLCQLITKAFANLLGISSVLYYYEIVYGISNYSPEWTPGRMLVVSAFAPVLSLVGGYFLLFGVVRKFPWKQFYLLFLLWLGFHLSNIFFGGLLAGTLTDHGLGYALDVFFWPMFFMYFLLSLIGIFCLVLVGYNSTEYFLKTNPSGYWLKRKNRRQYLLFVLVFPWLIGSFLMLMVKFPDHLPQHKDIALHDLILSLSMIFLILPMFFRSKTAQFRPENVSEGKKRNIWWYFVISTIVFVILYRVVLTSFFYSIFS